jgi:hypothetical protein
MAPALSVTSADRFLEHALAWFGDPDPKAGAPRDRGLRLADLVRREKTLLILDGVEPLQHPANHPLAGRLKDPGLAALLKNLAGGNPGLCVATTRERIADLDGSSSSLLPGGSRDAASGSLAEHLDHAVEGLRRAGYEEVVARGLLARSALRRLRGDLAGAEAEVSEVLEIAERGSMRIHECDAHLEWARLCRQRGDRAGQQEHVARARKLVEETGYGRRGREVEWLARGG